MVGLQREMTHGAMVRDNALIQLDIEEHRVRLAVEGKTENDPTVEQEARDMYFAKRPSAKNPRLSRADYLQVKKKGGSVYAKKIDKPKVNILSG